MMKNKQLQLNRTAKTVLMFLLLGVAGIEKMYTQTTVGNLNYSLYNYPYIASVLGYADESTATGELIIPESITYQGIIYTVTYIGNDAFKNCSSLTSLNIPNSVISIGANAFQNCGNLISLNIPNSVTSIGASAFQNCSSLISLHIPNSVTSIGAGAFRGTGWYDNQPDGILYLDECCLGYKGENRLVIWKLQEIQE